jgi:DNA-binding transcriptional LysR family regulator
MMALDDLRSFVEVVQSGGFNRAAKRLGISKSIVSRRMARLEAELGSRLLSRTTRGISPTEAGLELKVRSERIPCRARGGTRGGCTAVRRGGWPPSPLSPAVLRRAPRAPVLAEMAQRHPRLEMDVSYSDRLVDLIGERFDAAIRIGALKDSSLVARRIAPVRPVLVASPDYLARRGRPSTPGDLAGHDCLIYTGRTVAEWQFRAGKRLISIRPQGRLCSDSGEAVLQWAIAGLGIAEGPSFLASDAIESGALEPLLLDYARPEYGIYVVRPPAAHVPGKVRVPIDTLVERFGGEPLWDRCLMHVHRRERPA